MLKFSVLLHRMLEQERRDFGEKPRKSKESMVCWRMGHNKRGEPATGGLLHSWG